MKGFALRLPQDLFDKIQERATKNNRSINSEIIFMLKSIIQIPIIGKIKDGVISIEEELARR